MILCKKYLHLFALDGAIPSIWVYHAFRMRRKKEDKGSGQVPSGWQAVAGAPRSSKTHRGLSRAWRPGAGSADHTPLPPALETGA